MMESVSIKPTFVAIKNGSEYEYINPNSISRMSKDEFGNFEVYYSTKDEFGNEKFRVGNLARHVVNEGGHFNIIG